MCSSIDARRDVRRLIAGALAGTMLLAACGSDDAGDGAALPPPEEPAPAEEPSAEPPAEGVMLEIGYYGGLQVFQSAFQSQPALLVTADGQVLRPAAVPEIFPGPLVLPHTVATLSPEGLELLLAEIEDLGLLADVEYETESLVADASTATVVVRTADDTFRHEAYALGFDPGGAEDTPQRQALADAIGALIDLESVVGAELGDEAIWFPEGYQVVARPAGDLSGMELDPRLVPWPGDASVALADAAECSELARSDVGELLEGADQLTFFTDGGVTYEVAARPAYPDRTC